MPPSSLIPPEAPTIPLEEISGQNASSTVTVSAASPVDVGYVLAARYELGEWIGEGGMSRVYKATDLRLRAQGRDDAFVAVKVMKGPFDEPAGRFAALCAHVRQWRRLMHPSIARLFDCERDGSIVFITMEYLAGESLYAKLRKTQAAAAARAPRDGEEARLIIAAVADALGYAHSHGIVHGDIKPGNVIVTEHGEVKVIDFGLARWVAAAATPSYASPQLMAGESALPTDDVFSLACLAYEVLTGVHPFGGGPPALSRQAPPPLQPGLTPGEHAALIHALAPDRAGRTPSMPEFIAEFASPPRRPVHNRWPLWAAAVAAALAGWLILRPAQKPVAPPALPAASVPQAGRAPPPPAPSTGKPGEVIRDCSTCPSMTVLPPGEFQQGAAADDPDASSFEKPRHLVRINYVLAMSTTDITVDDFRQFISAMGRDMQGCAIYDGEWRRRSAASWQDPGFPQSGTHPATCISWNDAVAYTEWLSGRTGPSISTAERVGVGIRRTRRRRFTASVGFKERPGLRERQCRRSKRGAALSRMERISLR